MNPGALSGYSWEHASSSVDLTTVPSLTLRELPPRDARNGPHASRRVAVLASGLVVMRGSSGKLTRVKA
jgi:hypothetical protein